ncbi:MAG TPA: imidazole glycerol phosphate synthase subunit HisH [Candidatus Saccharimonadales bacterium]|nr:imidazole glycerol phosphate synthase subunit HisH [Candidatus Saccharimonadales bacterium]
MNNKIVVIDYGLGNLASVANALEKLSIPYEVSSDIRFIKEAKAIILPGVGAAGQGMKNLKDKNLLTVIRTEVKNGKPILGICLGMQLLFSDSEENNVMCLDLIKGKVKKFQTTLKIPEIGWNQVKITNKQTKLFANIPNNSNFYFVNSYYCEPDDKSIIAANTAYGSEFCSVLVKENIYGVQFHPEKSGEIGLQLINNFCDSL